MPGYQANLGKIAGYDAQVVGISVDSVFSHVAWQKSLGGLEYPLAADFYPHGEVGRRYGIFRSEPPIPGISERAIFIVDKEGRIAFARVYELSKVPDNEELFAELEKLNNADAVTGDAVAGG